MKDWIENSYQCDVCNTGIAQVPTSGVRKDNDTWVKMVYEFFKEHKDHGVEL